MYAVIILQIVIIFLLLKVVHNQKPIDEGGSPTWVVWGVSAAGWILALGVIGWLGTLAYAHWYR